MIFSGTMFGLTGGGGGCLLSCDAYLVVGICYYIVLSRTILCLLNLVNISDSLCFQTC